jgi:hypothetical protein
MVYDHTKQYRCTIVRGKAYKDLDELLNTYASIVNDICPCAKNEFADKFNYELSLHLGSQVTQKTLSNHRTEVVGKLFGMYFISNDEQVYCSPRVIKLLNDSDQPAYFKELLLKYQFPTGMSKVSTTREQISKKIQIRQFPFLMRLLNIADENKVFLKKSEIGYYVLNNLDVLTSSCTPEEVFEVIIDDRSKHIIREIKVAGKESSYLHQHINEQLNLMVLANLIYYVNDTVAINKREKKFIDLMASLEYEDIIFKFSDYDLRDQDQRNKMEDDWSVYFAEQTDLSPNVFTTSASSLAKPHAPVANPAEPTEPAQSTVDIGDEGEIYVFNYERDRVNRINPRLVNRIKLLGKIRGLGYDIHSVYGEGSNADFARYIEVKSTKRVTAPESIFNDSITITKNEFSAAQQHKDHYYIYRVYFTNAGVKLFVIDNFFAKAQSELLKIDPTVYRIEFNQDAGVYLSE